MEDINEKTSIRWYRLPVKALVICQEKIGVLHGLFLLKGESMTVEREVNIHTEEAFGQEGDQRCLW